MGELYSDTTPEYIVIDMTDPCCAIGALYKDIATIKAENAAAMNEASTLALAIHRRYYLKESPNFELCDSVAGIISQIDNMAAGLLNDNAALVEAAREVVKVLTGEYSLSNHGEWERTMDKLSALLPSEGEI